jgi:hypothetical protein
MQFQPLAVIKPALSAMKSRVNRCANHLYPPRDGSEKADGFPRQGAASRAQVATKDQQPPVRGSVRRKASPLVLQARRVAGERVARNSRSEKTLSRCPKLQRRQPRISAPLRNQRFMVAAFYQAAFVEHDDAIGFLDGGQAVRDD